MSVISKKRIRILKPGAGERRLRVRRTPLPSVAIASRGRVIHPDTTQDEIAAQAARLSAYAARDLTASIMGDPPVGFSALDERED